jgi:hypothetical protein
VCKVKGFTLDGKVEQQINFPSMLGMLMNKTVITVDYPDILKRDKSRFVIKQSDMAKRFRETYDKRRIVDGWNTLPFGFCSR